MTDRTISAIAVDWAQVRRALESGMTENEAAAACGVARSAVYNKVRAYDWGGHQSRKRRNTVMAMLLKAGETLARADKSADVERDAKRLAALSSMARALRAFDPRLAAQTEASDAAADFAAARAEQEQFDAEIDALIEARVAERLADRGAA